MKIKKGDNVKIISGKNKGKSGKVTQVFPSLQKVVIEGLNVRFKNMKAKRQGEKGQRIEFSSPLNVSKVMLIDPKSGQVTRIGYKTLATGEKVRIAKKSGEVI